MIIFITYKLEYQSIYFRLKIMESTLAYYLFFNPEEKTLELIFIKCLKKTQEYPCKVILHSNINVSTQHDLAKIMQTIRNKFVTACYSCLQEAKVRQIILIFYLICARSFWRKIYSRDRGRCSGCIGHEFIEFIYQPVFIK